MRRPQIANKKCHNTPSNLMMTSSTKSPWEKDRGLLKYQNGNGSADFFLVCVCVVWGGHAGGVFSLKVVAVAVMRANHGCAGIDGAGSKKRWWIDSGKNGGGGQSSKSSCGGDRHNEAKMVDNCEMWNGTRKKKFHNPFPFYHKRKELTFKIYMLHHMKSK